MADEFGNKYYIVLAMSGHSGSGKFRPVLQWVNSESQLGANELARNYPRVKHDQKRVIIASNECTYHEGLLVKIINDFDTYLTENDNSENDDKSVDKQSNVEKLIGLYRKTRNTKYLDFVKTKDSYPFEDQILQRFCAPIRVRNEIIYEKHHDLHSMLDEYFTFYVKKLALVPSPKLDSDIADAINNKEPFSVSQANRYEVFLKEKLNRTRMLLLYYGLFGENNPFGVCFDGSTLTFKNLDGNKEVISIPHGDITAKDNKYEYKLKKLVLSMNGIKPIYEKETERTF